MSNVPFIEITANPKIPELAPGDTVRVYNRIVEGDKERVQMFQGVVIRISRGGAGANFTVRRISHGVGIERTFPTYSPLLEKVEVTRHGKVRRARLYYLRGLSAKKARIKERRVIDKPGVEVLEPEELAAIEAEEMAAENIDAEAVAEEPVAEATVEAVAEEPVAEAAVEAVAEEPVAEAAAEEPVVEAAAEEVVSEAAAEEPVAEAAAEEPVAEAAAEEPVAEAKAEVTEEKTEGA